MTFARLPINDGYAMPGHRAYYPPLPTYYRNIIFQLLYFRADPARFGRIKPAPNSGASCAGVTPHSLRSAGAMKPTAAVSKPSIATTRKQSAMTSFWNPETGWAFMTSWTSMLRAVDT